MIKLLVRTYFRQIPPPFFLSGIIIIETVKRRGPRRAVGETKGAVLGMRKNIAWIGKGMEGVEIKRNEAFARKEHFVSVLGQRYGSVFSLPAPQFVC